MRKSFKNKQGGFLRMVVIVIVTILILVYWGEDIKKFLETDQAKQIAKKIIVIMRDIWAGYIKVPLALIWDKVVVDIIWNMILKPLIGQVK